MSDKSRQARYYEKHKHDFNFMEKQRKAKAKYAAKKKAELLAKRAQKLMHFNTVAELDAYYLKHFNMKVS